MHQQILRPNRRLLFASLTFCSLLVGLLLQGLGSVAAQTSEFGPATELYPGRAVTTMLGFGDRRLDDGSYYRAYGFYASAGQRVRITMNSDDFDSYLFLMDEHGTVLTTDDDSAGGYDARIEYTIPRSGNYIVLANSLWSWGEGWYTILLEFSGDPQTPGSNETILSFGQSITARLGPTDDVLLDGSYVKRYSFSGTEGQQVRISMTSNEFDAYLLLLDPDGDFLLSDDDSAGGTNATIDIQLPVTGVYTVLANSFRAGEQGTFTIRLDDMGMIVDGRVTRRIAFDQTVTGSLGIGDERLGDGTYFQRYTFNGFAGQTVRITLRSNDFDSYLYLYDGQGRVIATDNNSGGLRDARIEMELPITGPYEILVNTLWAGETGQFTLDLVEVGNASHTPRSQRISFGETVYGSLDPSDDLSILGSYSKRYTFNGVAGQRVRITLSSDDFSAVVDLNDPYNAEVDFAFGSAGRRDAQIEVELPMTGPYEILVYSILPRVTGRFTLTLEELGIAPLPDQPDHISWGQTIHGFLGPGDEQLSDGTYAKRYTITGRGGDEVRITMRSNDFDSYLYLLNEHRIYLESDNNSGGGRDARILITLPADGVYQIVANTLYPGESGAFTLTVENLSAPSSVEEHVRSIRLGETVQDRLERTNPQLDDGSHYRIYVFDGVAGQRVRVRMRSNEIDAYLVLGDLDGVAIAHDDDSGGGTDALIEAILPRTDTYMIVVTSFWPHEVGRFTLETEVLQGGGPGAPGNYFGELRSGVRRFGRIPGDTLFQFWRLQVPPGTTRVEVRIYQSEGQLDLVAAPGTQLSTNLHHYPHRALTARENERLVIYPAPGESLFTVGVLNWTFSDVGYQIEVAFDSSLPPATVYTPSLTDYSLLSPLQRAIRATVQIQTEVGMGSGTILTPDGIILTNYHVIAECEIYGVFSCEGDLLRGTDGEYMELIVGLSDETRGYAVQYFVARPLRWLPEYDLALIEIVSDLDGNPVGKLQLPTVPIDPSLSATRLADEVIAIGYPSIAQVSSRVPLTLTRGIVSGYTHVGGERVFINTDADINQGNSGGALISADTGVLIGIPSSGRVDANAGEKSNFARSLNLLPQEWIDLLRARGAEIVQSSGPIIIR